VLGRLHQQTLRGSGRALGHAIILATTTDRTGPSTAAPAKILSPISGTAVFEDLDKLTMRHSLHTAASPELYLSSTNSACDGDVPMFSPMCVWASTQPAS